MGSTHTPTLSSMPNALHAEWWLTRAKAKEENGDILVSRQKLHLMSVSFILGPKPCHAKQHRTVQCALNT